MGGGVEGWSRQGGVRVQERKKETEHAISKVISQSGGSSGASTSGCTEVTEVKENAVTSPSGELLWFCFIITIITKYM